MKDTQTILARPHTAEVIERLVRYAKIETTSNRLIETIPSTQQQFDLAQLLVEELKGLGIKDANVDEHCYVIARIPASPGLENKPAIGFMAHVDTASDVSGKDVKPRIVKNYDGKALKLSENWTLDPANFEELAEYVGDTLIVTDGTTLLGADDKGGVAVIMTAISWLQKNPSVKHGPLYAIFTPDEETGKGMDLFPLKKLDAVACFTFDGGKGGELEMECFNAYEAKITFTGKASHPGYARGVMVNAASMAAHFASMLPRTESPEATDGWFGYFYIGSISGGLEHAELTLLMRDFSDTGMQRRIEAVKAFGAAIEAQFPGGKASIEFKKQYLNMRKKLDQSPKVIEALFTAATRAGAEPFSKPIRGGTDGARLTEMGIPTPNIFAGMHNFHGRYEWASASEMVLAVDTLLELAKLWAE